jgi:hypothetical protein
MSIPSAPGAHDARLDEKPLPAPTLDIPHKDNVIDDGLVLAAKGSGLPFRIPQYTGVAVGDAISLMLDGRLVKYFPIDDVGQINNLLIYVPVSFFNFTGKCDIYYIVEKRSQNINISDPASFIVVRNDYPDPDEGGDLPPPVVVPERYALKQYNDGEQVVVTVLYPGMSQNDVVTVRFELRADTADQLGKVYFYDISDLQATVSSQDVLNRRLVFPPLPAATFRGIDENIGTVYYRVDSTNRMYGVAYSERAKFQVDVVPPHG